MSETDRMTFYNRTRVLIESDRVLEPPGKGRATFLSASHLEMLRNLTHYLHRRTSFVSEYAVQYYMMPDDTDWDAIEEIVAELELNLMPDNVTVWGYSDRLHTVEDDTVASGTTLLQNHTTVPSGEVWVVSGFNLWSSAAVPSVLVVARMFGANCPVGGPLALTAGIYYVSPAMQVTLKEGDWMQVSWAGLAVGQRCISNVWGYKMDVG